MPNNLTFLIIENEEHLELFLSDKFDLYMKYLHNNNNCESELSDEEIENFDKYSYEFDDRFSDNGYELKYYDNYFSHDLLRGYIYSYINTNLFEDFTKKSWDGKTNRRIVFACLKN